jgi:hypothetical protein
MNGRGYGGHDASPRNTVRPLHLHLGPEGFFSRTAAPWPRRPQHVPVSYFRHERACRHVFQSRETAVATFGQIQRKDTVSWSTVIPCLANDGDERAAAAASCFIHMPTSGSKPNQVLPPGIRPCLP